MRIRLTTMLGPRTRHVATWPVISLSIVIVLLELQAPLQAQEHYELDNQGWQKLDSPPPDSPRGQLQTIRKALARNDADRARDLSDQWIKAHPKHPLLVEAYLLRGDAKIAQRRYYQALFDYEQVITQYPASQQFKTALGREFEIARLYLNGLNRRVFGLRIFPAVGEGEELLIRIQERAPGSETGRRASLKLADYYFDSSQMDQAATAYDLFIENYPNSRQRELARLRLIQANLARYKGPAYDQRGLLEAQQQLEIYTDHFPAAAERIGAEALGVRIRESLARRDLITADWYRRRGQTVSAATLYRRLVREYPETAAGATALDRLNDLDVDLDFLPRESEGKSRSNKPR